MSENLNKTKNTQSNLLKVISLKDMDLTTKPEALSPACFAVSIRTLLQNWRQGTVGCKTRADVSYSNKKPWKQKGTGRARAGSRRSPIWVGGGIIFGPQPRTRKLKINRGLKRSLLNNMIWNLLETKRAFTLDYTVPNVPKTSEAYNALKQSNLHDKKVVFLVSPNDFLTQSAFANISNVRMLLFDELNSFDLSAGHVLVILKKDTSLFKEMVLKWI